jgi:hypothetical protein
MERINNECYVSLEVAKLLKKAGFDWDTYNAYNKDGVFADKNRNLITWNHFSDYYSAPTLEAAQRWLREVGNKNGTVILTLNFNENISKHWGVKGIHLNKDRTVMHWFYTCHVKPYGRGIILVDCWDIYEEAQEAGIKKALEILLEKGE